MYAPLSLFSSSSPHSVLLLPLPLQDPLDFFFSFNGCHNSEDDAGTTSVRQPLELTFSQHHHLSHQGTTSVRQPPELSQRRAIIPRSPTLSVSLSPLFRPSPPQHHLPGCHISSHRITTVPLPPLSVDHLHHHQRPAVACRLHFVLYAHLKISYLYIHSFSLA